MVKRGTIGVILLAAAMAAGAWWFASRRPHAVFTLPPTPEPAPADVPKDRQVLLANRTLWVAPKKRAFPANFAETQKPTPRGTAPYAVVCEAPVTGTVRERAEALGVRVVRFLPSNALLVETDAAGLKKLEAEPLFAAAFEVTPVDKLQRALAERIAAGEDALEVAVLALTQEDRNALQAEIEKTGGELLKGCLLGPCSLRARVPADLALELIGRGEVTWVEGFARPKLLNDCAVTPAAMNVSPVWNAHGLTGEGQLVSTSDSGIDTGDLETMHADLTNAVVWTKQTSETSQPADVCGHGTHTAGSIVGDGALSGGQIKGVAFDAKLQAWFCYNLGSDGIVSETDDGLDIPSSYDALCRPAEWQGRSASIHSASWGVSAYGAYDVTCAEVDEWLWNHPDFLFVVANGNDGSAARTVNSPATAKNVLSVGATQNVRTDYPGYGGGVSTLASFSSRGPCADGRVKPDLCAPGAAVLSTRSQGVSDNAYDWGVYSANTHYAYNGGTSMATPLTAGAAALARQWLVDRRGYTNVPPTAALLKAILTGGAKNVLTPDNGFGWGCVDLEETLYPSNRTVFIADRIPFSYGSEQAYEIMLTNAAPFDAQLAWIDYPATTASSYSGTLVNDLDLVVSNRTTGAVWFGNGSTTGDHVNTLESVRIASAEPGNYVVYVRGCKVPYASTEGGAAALYVRGAFDTTNATPEVALVLTAAEPEATSVSMPVGATNAFSVTVAASEGLAISYAWTLDGAAVAGATTNRFAYAPVWDDRGAHVLAAVASGGGLTASRTWTISVWGEVSVDAETGDDDSATGEAAHPFATIAAALTNAVAGDRVRVGPGTYAGGVVAPATALCIESLAGPASTIIDGGGTNRCYNGAANPSTVLSGFTLTNGWIDASGTYYEEKWNYKYGDGYGAGAYYGTLTNCVVVDCRIEDDGSCTGYGYGGGAAYATLVDCRVEKCSAVYAGGGLWRCDASYCTLVGNEAAYYTDSYGGGASASTLDHCTVFGNMGGGVDADCCCTNCIVWGNVLDSGVDNNWKSNRDDRRGWYATRFVHCCTTPTGYDDGGGNTNADPRWADAENGDFRLAVQSPCLGAASDGLNMGAWQGAGVPGVFISTATVGPGEIEPETAFVEEGGSATFEISGHHTIVGIATNDVPVAITNVFTWANPTADGTLAVTFANTNFFVDAAQGDDASNGWSWTEAKRTIQAAVDVAGEGETVFVNPGVYTEEVFSASAQIEIVGVEGPEATKIVGEGGTNRCFVGYYNPATRLVGFTLENGASTNNYGGGVFYGTLSNCVIRNCHAAWGGGGAYVATLYGCSIADCEAGLQGGGAYDSTLVNCTVRGNRAGALRSAASEYAGGGVDHQCSCTNTVLWGNVGPSGGEDNWEAYVYQYYRYEGPRRVLCSSTYVPRFYWCCTTPANSVGENCFTDDPQFASANDCADARVYETSPCIGSGKDGANVGAYAGTGVVLALPEIDALTATGEEVSNAVASVGYVDESVAAGIGTNAQTYVDFQAWSETGGGTNFKQTAVVFSTRAYDSFLVRDVVATPTLLADGAETSIELTALEPAADGTCSTVVTLTDGDNAVPLRAAKEAFAAKTRLGSDVDALAPASSDQVEAESVDGGNAVKLTITPPAGVLRYFLKLVFR